MESMVLNNIYILVMFHTCKRKSLCDGLRIIYEIRNYEKYVLTQVLLLFMLSLMFHGMNQRYNDEMNNSFNEISFIICIYNYFHFSVTAIDFA